MENKFTSKKSSYAVTPASAQQLKAQARTVAEPLMVTALAALAHVQRLRVFRALVQAGMSGLQPSVMAAMLDAPPSSLSFHLKELTHAQLVNVEQQGRNLIYRANFMQMQQLMAYLTENCCAADPGDGCC
jgi:ArsR family transcriptional regulator, arsenate/arsenite/antimonite-responsive transcriptional repressor